MQPISWPKLAAIAGGITAMYGAAAVLDAPVPKPAWASQVERLAADLDSVKQLALEQAIESAELRWVRLKAEAQRYRDRGEAVPAFMEAEITALERRIRSREAELEALR